jgi:MFS transporter, OPA family, solute carrier family 37 (glycerol-3-phosphate transporter), member 1/2
MTRKPISVVKSVLHQNCSAIERPDNLVVTDDNEQTWCDYPPFDQPDAKARLAVLDSAFLFAYAIAMFASGFIAERVSLRYFLSLGMLFSGIFCYAFGLARTYDIHSMGYFILIQAAAGIFQTTGWPGVVTLVGRWFGKSKRGLIFGIWNSHTSIGNIVGTLIASHYVEKDWALSFIVPGFIMGVLGFVIFLFLVESPETVGLTEDGGDAATSGDRRNSYRRMEGGGNDSGESEAEEYVGEQVSLVWLSGANG